MTAEAISGRKYPSGDFLSEARSHFDEHGYVILPAFLSVAELSPAQASIPKLFPTPDEFHGDPTAEESVPYARRRLR